MLILSASDTLADTIRPRLDAAGADPNRVFVLPKITDLRHDFAKLRAAVDRAPNCRLIIVDPVNAYVGPSDSHFHTVVRRVLAPLAELATEKGIAILAVTHLRKNDGTAIQRAAGSMGFVATASTIWTVAQDHHDPNRRLLLPLKNNLAPAACGLAFQIASHPASHAPHLTWDPNPVTISPRDALRSPKPERRPTEREEARAFLRAALAAGPCPAKQLLEEGQERGFTNRTLQRAFHDLDGHTAKRGWYGGWWWSLGEYHIDPNPDMSVDPPGLFEKPVYAIDVAFLAEYERRIGFDQQPPSTHSKKNLSPSVELSSSSDYSPKQPTLRESMTYLNRTFANRRKQKSPDKANDLPSTVNNRKLTRELIEEVQKQLDAKFPAPPAACGLAPPSRDQPPGNPRTNHATSLLHPDNDIIEWAANAPLAAPPRLAPSATMDAL